MKIRLKTLPVSTNHMYAGRRLLTRAARLNKEAMGWEARAQYHGDPVETPVRLRTSFWWPDKRNHDIDNIKALLDAFTGILWADDGQIDFLMLKKGIDAKNPRVEMVEMRPEELQIIERLEGMTRPELSRLLEFLST